MAPGSSPRVRGKLDGYGADGTTSRIIPARAGQTNTYRDMYNQPPDHPRACGANGLLAQLVRAAFGSSPRVRGKPRFGRAASMVLRIIPARAGQTKRALQGNPLTTDHPRACGANVAGKSEKTVRVGSSPRVRGKLMPVTVDISPVRIIPARAGQTMPIYSTPVLSTDHPRACGANDVRVIAAYAIYGSSPRVRGKRTVHAFRQIRTRIIPARAGQTVRFYAKTLERWTLNNWIRTVAPIFVLLFLLPVIGQNAYIERHYSNQSFSWFSKLHYASAFDLSLVA